MKKIIIALLLVLFMAGNVWAANLTVNAENFCYAKGDSGSWPPVYSVSDNAFTAFEKRGVSGSYFLYNGFISFDTSNLPDNATVTSATLKLRLTYQAASSVAMGGAYYNYTSPSSSSDYATSQTANACTFNTSSLSISSQTDITLSNVSNISKTGSTQFRFIPTDGTPASSTQYGGQINSSSLSYATLSIEYSTPPGVPGNPTFTNVANKSMTISWTAATGATSYTLQRNGSNISTSATSPYNDSGLTVNTSYTYRVIAVNADGSTNCAADQSQTTTYWSKKMNGSTVKKINGTYVDKVNGL